MTINPKPPAAPKCETPMKETNPKSDAGKSSNQDDFSNGLAAELAMLASHGKHLDVVEYKFMLSVVNGNKRDAKIDAMLSVQMTAIHSAIVRITSYLAHSETLEELDCHGRTLNKLARTFIDQREALQRNRPGSEQSVKVQNVSVGEGGQAIVGNVTQTPRKNAPEKPATASPLELPDARTAPMPIMDKSKERVAIPARDSSNK